MPAKAEGLEQLLVEKLQDLYDAEKQLVKALPRISKSCSDEELSNAFRQHLEVTKGQVQRLEQVFEHMGMRARGKPCKGMKGLVEEGQELIEEHDEPMMLDAGLLGAGRKVEHYEMASYEGARMTALQLGMREAAQLLQETLREEMETDKHLAQISKRLLKEASAMGSAQGEEEEAGTSRRGRGSQSARGQSSRGGQAGGGRSARGSSRASSGNAGSRSGRSGRSQGGGQSSGRSGRGAQPLTDHEVIRQWAEERGARPACVRGTGGKGDTGMIRLDFPGFSGEESLEEISWDDWFEKFDQNNLALIVQETVGGRGGQKSNFNKLVSRETAESRQRPKARAAR